MSVIERFEGLADKLEREHGRFALFAIVLTRGTRGLISTSSDSAGHSHDRWAILASAPWLRSGRRMADTKALTNAINSVGERRMLENDVSMIVVAWPTPEAVRLLQRVQDMGSAELVTTANAVLHEPEIAGLFDKVVRMRVLRADPALARV